MNTRYDVIYVPTEAGINLFKTPRKFIKRGLLKDNADELAYLKYADDSTPDKSEFYRYEVKPCPLQLVVSNDLIDLVRHRVLKRKALEAARALPGPT